METMWKDNQQPVLIPEGKMKNRKDRSREGRRVKKEWNKAGKRKKRTDGDRTEEGNYGRRQEKNKNRKAEGWRQG